MKYGRAVAAASRAVTASLPAVPHRPDLALTLSSGRLARLAPGAVRLCAGPGASLLATAVPAAAGGSLVVDFRERAAARGIIPGTFPRRELAMAQAETLAARLVDRSLRPVLHGGAPLAIGVRLLSADRPGTVAIDALAVNAASAAAAAAAAAVAARGPHGGCAGGERLVGAARLARVDGGLVAFPSLAEVLRAEASVFVAVRADGRLVAMGVDAVGAPVGERSVLALLEEAVGVARIMIGPQVELLERLAEVEAVDGRAAYPRVMPRPAGEDGDAVAVEIAEEVRGRVRRRAQEVYEAAFVACREFPGKAHRADVVTRAQQALVDEFGQVPMEAVLEVAQDAARDAHAAVLRRDGRRMDGRAPADVRLVRAETGVLGGAVHGSALFERGDTQVLACATIGLPRSAQRVADHVDTADGLADELAFFLHYAFPGYATGEQDKFGAGGAGGGGSRRETGHGALAEAALRPVVGEAGGGVLPYVARVSAEVTASDGSSSMATVCAGALALLDAGVPLRQQVAGVAMGLVAGEQFGVGDGGDDADCVVLTDILGAEDHFGCMDCKVSGTVDGVTAAQMDVKLAGGVPLAVVGRVLDEARAARVGILATMAEAAPEQAKGLPHGAPRSISVPVDRQLVIKTLLRDRAAGLKEIELASRSRLFLEQDGATPVIRVDAPSAAAAEDALRLLRESLADIEVGTKLRGRVVDVRPAYALVETQAGALTGMLHVSKMNLAVPTAPAPLGGGKTPDQLRYPDVRRVLRVGEELEVVCVESERQKGVLRFGLLADPRLGAGEGDAFLEEVRGSPLKENMPPAGAPTDRRRRLQRES